MTIDKVPYQNIAITEEVMEESKQDSQLGSADAANTVPFYKLFCFADSFDKFMMIVGSVGAVGNALAMPLITIIFGELVDSFGRNQRKDIVPVVSKVRRLVTLLLFLRLQV